MPLARTLVLLAEAYCACGALFALAFVTRLVARLDPSAHSGTLGFRVLIFPGAAALWPYLVWKLWRGREARSK